MNAKTPKVLDRVNMPADLRGLSHAELDTLSSDIRDLILETMNKNGGHLASNLGAVELTVALHRSFDFLKDVLLFDVSHQCYTHKILTGRKDRFPTIRTTGGLFGFTNKEESPFDHYTWSHASTSVSSGLGITTGMALQGNPIRTVCVVGDAALSAGMPFEALNNAGVIGKNLIVVLNDNKMSIAPVVGAFAGYLNKIRTAPLYNDFRKDLRSLLEKFPRVEQLAQKFREGLLTAVSPGHIFETLGFRYFGPIDGHNIPMLLDTFDKIKDIEDVLLVHVVTEKGRGYKAALDDPYKYHGAKPNFKVPDSINTSETPRNEKKDYSKAFGEIIIEMAKADPRIVALTAAMPDGTGLVDFQREFPDRFFDVGICEQHGVAFCSGLSQSGIIPVAAIYSTFLQRAFDQVFHEVTLQNYKVVFAMDRAGFVGHDGATAHGLADIAYLRIWPNMILCAPRDEEELRQMLFFAKDQASSCAVRYPRESLPTNLPSTRTPLELGRSEVLADGSDGCLFAYGSMVTLAEEARRRLEKRGLRLKLINARFAKPLDIDALVREVGSQPLVFTLEEAWLDGGFGSACLEALAQRGSDTTKIRRLGIPNIYVGGAGRGDQLRQVGLDPESLEKSITMELAALSGAPR
ncbi:MAG: 1-deoxy-D-xylulose-5-phosphate synthase [Planctomycetota bacterium]